VARFKRKKNKSNTEEFVPPFFREETKARKKVRASRAQEKTIAEAGGVLPQPASGAFVGYKSDVDWGDVRHEGKTTINPDRKSFSIKKEDIVKICGEAFLHRQIPAMNFRIPGMPEWVPQDWIMVPLSAFVNLRNKANAK